MSATVKSIRTVLSPLLIVNYICGIRIIEFPAGHPRPRFGLLYSLLLWSIFCSFLLGSVTSYLSFNYTKYITCIWLNIFTALATASLDLYHSKKFRDCIRKLTIVDDTLEKLGTTTDYDKLRLRVIGVLSAWLLAAFVLNYVETSWWRHKYDIKRAIYISLMLNYCCHITFMDDVTFASIMEYIGLKFDQVNEHLHKLADDRFTDNEPSEVKQAWENSVPRDSHQRKFPDASSNEFIAWVVIHLHLELRKISDEVNSAFGMQLTLKMACYFAFMAELFQELFDILFTKQSSQTNICYMIITSWLVLYLFRLLLINYVCERVSAKANTTRNFIRVSYTCNEEIRENIMQLLLQITRAPLRFHGLGLFQFGFKFLGGYAESILTFLIILVQANKTNYLFFQKF